MEKNNQESMYLYQSKEVKSALRRWWQSMMLSPDELKTKNIQRASSGMKAQLKRCESADAAMMTDGFRSLWFSFPAALTEQAKPRDIERWAIIAAALVYVQQVSESKMAYAAGSKGEGDKAVVSEMRFSQFQNAKTPNEFLRRLRRILQQVKGTVAAISLAQDIEQWFIEQHAFRPRKAENRVCVKWAMEYYRASATKSSK